VGSIGLLALLVFARFSLDHGQVVEVQRLLAHRRGSIERGNDRDPAGAPDLSAFSRSSGDRAAGYPASVTTPPAYPVYPVDAIAKLLNLTPRRIRQLVAEGIIPRVERASMISSEASAAMSNTCKSGPRAGGWSRAACMRSECGCLRRRPSTRNWRWRAAPVAPPFR
jgi:hypothetical protein